MDSTAESYTAIHASATQKVTTNVLRHAAHTKHKVGWAGRRERTRAERTWTPRAHVQEEGTVGVIEGGEGPRLNGHRDGRAACARARHRKLCHREQESLTSSEHRDLRGDATEVTTEGAR